jgi:NitT/TauT family transport system substrate-binding protein
LATPFLMRAARAADQRMTVSEYGVVLHSLPWAVAQQTGLLKKHDTGVEGFLGANGGGTAIRNMMASDLAFAELSVPAAIAASRTGIDLRFVFSSVNNMGELSWVVPVNSPIKKIEDLRGHKAAFTSPRSTTEMVLRIILAKAGLSNDVQIMPAGGMGAAVTALNQGAVDAAPMVDPLLTTGSDRYRVLFRVNDYVPDICWSVGITTPAFAASNGEQIRRLILARREALEAMRQDPAMAAQVYAKVWNIDPALATRVLPKFFDMKFWSAGNFDLPGLQVQADGMRVVGQLEGPVDFNTLIDRRFLPDDLRA